MQTARHLVRTFIKLTTSVQHSHNHLKSRTTLFFVHIHRNTTTIICHCYRIVRIDIHLNVSTITCQSFVNRVVNYLINQVVQTLRTSVANIHRRTFTYGFKTLEHLNTTCAVLFCGTVFCFFCHIIYCKLVF